MEYNLLKTLHIIFLISWFAGLFYLPRIFVYHAMAEDKSVWEHFKVMERKLYNYIMTPAMILTVTFGLVLWFRVFPQAGGWIHIKTTLVVLLVVYHFMCGHYVKVFSRDENPKSHKYYRVFNEVPTLLLAAITYLVIFKPFG